MLGTGTGLAPFMSLIRDPETYEPFERVVLVHGCRTVGELVYEDLIKDELPHHELLGELVQEKLIYYPTVTREAYAHQGRVTDLIFNGQTARRPRPAAGRSTHRTASCCAAAPACWRIIAPG